MGEEDGKEVEISDSMKTKANEKAQKSETPGTFHVVHINLFGSEPPTGV